MLSIQQVSKSVYHIFSIKCWVLYFKLGLVDPVFNQTPCLYGDCYLFINQVSFSPCISSAKNKIMSIIPKELLKKCWRDHWDEKYNTRKKARLVGRPAGPDVPFFSSSFQLEVGTVSRLSLENPAFI